MTRTGRKGPDGEPLDDGYDHNWGGEGVHAAVNVFARKYDERTLRDARRHNPLEAEVEEPLVLDKDTERRVRGLLSGEGRNRKDTRAAIMILRGDNPQLVSEVETALLNSLALSRYADLNNYQRELLACRILARYQHKAESSN